MRKTRALLQVAMELLDDAEAKHWGYELGKRSGVRSGVLYPMLSRMLDQGWLADGWENPVEMTERRPPRRYYRLTEEGKLQLGGLVREAERDARFRALYARWAG